jgi:ribosomal protein S18 acetylase RimI-like enzyme
MTDSQARISIEADVADEVRNVVQSGLFAYNLQFAPPRGYSALTIAARDNDNKIIGGLIGQLLSGWKWLHVDRLWVDEAYRRAGIGRLLLGTAEKEAQSRGCLHAEVDTFDFQARGFYEKQGYNVYAVLEDFPVGHTKFLMRKTL